MAQGTLLLPPSPVHTHTSYARNKLSFTTIVRANNQHLYCKGEKVGWEKPARIPGWAPTHRGVPGRRACSGRCRAPEEPHLQPRRVSAGSAPPRLARPGVCRSGRSPVPGEGTLTLDPGSGAPYSDPEPRRVSPGPHLLPLQSLPLAFLRRGKFALYALPAPRAGRLHPRAHQERLSPPRAPRNRTAGEPKKGCPRVD